MKIDTRLKFERFNRKTHGMGLLLLLLLAVVIAIQIPTIIINFQKQQQPSVYVDGKGNRVLLCPDSCIWRVAI